MPRFTGLETPPATPDSELERRLEILSVNGLGLAGSSSAAASSYPQLSAVAKSSAQAGVPTPTASPAATAAGLSPPPRTTTAPVSASAVAAPAGPTEFRFFPALPAELRIKVWQQSFEPRVVELHTRRSHYATEVRHGGTLKWQSCCANPAALAVCTEAREVAMSHYSVAIPLAVSSRPSVLTGGDDVADLYHRLYVNCHEDTVVLLGELDLSKLRSLLEMIRDQDPGGVGLRRLGLSAACFKHVCSDTLLKMYSKTVFRDLEELVLFMYAEIAPPEWWKNGTCVLEDCTGKDFFRRWEMAGGRQLKTEDGGWLVVGKKELAVMDLIFVAE